MIAVKEAMSVPDAVFLPMVVVDTVVPYVWMGMLVALAGGQAMYDRWNKSDRRILDQLSRKISQVRASQSIRLKGSTTILIVLLGVSGGLAAHGAAGFFPVVKDMISTYAWTIILVTFLGIGLSFTPVRKLENFGSTKIGYFLLYFVLTSIGAKASIADIGSTLILILAGFCLALIHASVLILASRLMKAPMFLVAVASQANIGGVASAPIVAEIYQPGFASVGLLLAILGNIIGTYLGLLVAQICRLIVS